MIKELIVVEGKSLPDCAERFQELYPLADPDMAATSDVEPIDPIEGGFPESEEEAWDLVKNRVQLFLFKDVTPLLVFLTYAPPHRTGRGKGHERDEEVRGDTFAKLATTYGYELIEIYCTTSSEKEGSNG